MDEPDFASIEWEAAQAALDSLYGQKWREWPGKSKLSGLSHRRVERMLEAIKTFNLYVERAKLEIAVKP